MKYYIIIFFCFLFINSFCQTGIGTTSPDPSAKLDVTSTNKGFLPPRVTLTGYMDNSTIPSPATGLLVYNTGSNSNLAAGYYYWNGSAWATIATAGGSGSFAASFMRGSRNSSQTLTVNSSTDVVIFSNIDASSGSNISLNTTTGKITLTPGNTYRLMGSIPGFSGTRPSFSWYNETSGVTIGNTANGYGSNDGAGNGTFGGEAEVIFTPTVTTVVSLKLVSVNNSTSSGSISIGNGDFPAGSVYPWFEAQVISGNAPVTGQSVDYGIVRYTGSDTGPLTTGSIVPLDASASGNIVWSNNKFTLKANKTYELESFLTVYQTGGGVGGVFQLYDYTNSAVLANGLFISMNGVGTNNPSGNGPMRAIVTPTSDMQVGIKFISFYGTLNAPGLIGSANNATGGAPNQCYFIAKQIGSSAIVNPWVLSGNDVYNTTGKVGIGTSSPAVSAILDLTSSTQGLLPPRLALTAKSGASTPIASPTTGLVVYNSATAGSTSDAVSPGFYYFNGTVWVRMDPDGWSSNTAISFSAPSGYTAPTKGASPIVDYVKYRNIGGKDYEVEYNLVQSTAGTGGNGDYLISLPAGLQFDNTYPGQAFYTGAAGFAAMKNKLASAIGDLIVANFHNSATVIPYNATQFRIQTNNWGNSTNTWLFMGYNNYSLVDANTTMKMVFRFRAL